MINSQQELNKVCSRLERRLEKIEQRMIDVGDYTYYRQKKSNELLQEYENIQNTIQKICTEFRENN